MVSGVFREILKLIPRMSFDVDSFDQCGLRSNFRTEKGSEKWFYSKNVGFPFSELSARPNIPASLRA